MIPKLKLSNEFSIKGFKQSLKLAERENLVPEPMYKLLSEQKSLFFKSHERIERKRGRESFPVHPGQGSHSS
jgi:hypothetical protein